MVYDARQAKADFETARKQRRAALQDLLTPAGEARFTRADEAMRRDEINRAYRRTVTALRAAAEAELTEARAERAEHVGRDPLDVVLFLSRERNERLETERAIRREDVEMLPGDRLASRIREAVESRDLLASALYVRYSAQIRHPAPAVDEALARAFLLVYDEKKLTGFEQREAAAQSVLLDVAAREHLRITYEPVEDS